MHGLERQTRLAIAARTRARFVPARLPGQRRVARSAARVAPPPAPPPPPPPAPLPRRSHREHHHVTAGRTSRSRRRSTITVTTSDDDEHARRADTTSTAIIGRGGMALVFLAHDRELERSVAREAARGQPLRRPELRGAVPAGGRTRPAALPPERGQCPRRAVRPTAVRFIVLEYVDGGNLAEELARAGPSAAGAGRSAGGPGGRGARARARARARPPRRQAAEPPARRRRHPEGDRLRRRAGCRRHPSDADRVGCSEPLPISPPSRHAARRRPPRRTSTRSASCCTSS